MIHYIHPKQLTGFGQDDFRYGDIAIVTLIEQLRSLTDEAPSTFVAKIVGGASEKGGIGKAFDVGFENVKIAKEILAQHEIPIVGESVGGTAGRKAIFHTATNRLQVAKMEPKENRVDPSSLVNPLAITGRPSTVSSLKGATPGLSKKRKILIVDDSKTIRDLLKRILLEDPDFEIIGMASDALEASKLVRKQRPDVITLDIHMPGMTGIEWLEKLLPKNPIPVVMISSLQLQEGNEVFKALEIGAVDYIQKPLLSDLPVVGPLIREKVKEASFAKVLSKNKTAAKAPPILGADLDMRKILAIGASTGGIEALRTVLEALPAMIPPTVIVQHIPPVFSKAFADRLNELCSFDVKEAEDGDALQPSLVLIAPGGKQMKIEQRDKGYFVKIMDEAPVNRHKPSVDYLFHSVASVIGKNSVGVILTGMGADGAKGLLAMKKAGARTIAQDEATSAVYGMPKAAFEIGAVDTVAPLPTVANEIIRCF
jgi:two-component system chemotaxis response regulator CheB